MKKPSTVLKELRKELHYHQEMVKVDIRAVKAGIRKVRQIAAKMRRIQNEKV